MKFNTATSALLTGALAVSALAIGTLGIPQTPAANAAPPVTAKRLAAVAGTWGVDKPHSSINFSINHIGISEVPGRFNDFDGKVHIDSKNLAKSSVNFTIKTASIDTGVEQRDAHLRTPDFFNAEKYPEITFKSIRIAQTASGFRALGTLSMHGVSRQIVLPFTVSGPLKGMDKKTHLGIKAGITLDRRDYVIKYSQLIEGVPLVGNQVKVNINLDLVKES